MTTLTIAHIADIHIVPREGELLRGIDVRKNFVETLRSIEKAQPDIIVVGGDLAAQDGELGAYRWIKTQLERTGIEYCVLAGNHDCINNMARVFSQTDRQNREDWQFHLERKGHGFHCLDSSSNSLPERQIHRLAADMGTQNGEALLFLHHPPLWCDCRYMDRKYPLGNWRETICQLKAISRIKNIFCGHYHTEKTIRTANKSVFITPATYMQISQESPEFKISDCRPGWRWIRWDGEALYTSVHYIQPLAGRVEKGL